MVVKCKDGKKQIYTENILDSICFVQSKDGLQQITDENGLPLTLSDKISCDIDLINGRVTESGFIHVTVPCVEGITVVVNKFNHHPNDILFIFKDCNGATLSSVYNDSGNGAWAYQSATAPVNTSYVTIRFFEPANCENRTKGYFVVNSNILGTLVSGAAKSCKPKTFGYIGDSTCQGVSDQVNNDMINNEGVVYKGCVGGENVFASAARQGAIPLVIEPFTIPSSSIERWSRATGSLVKEGNDPQITITPIMLYNVKDAEGNNIKQIYSDVFFDKAYPFYATVAGVSGYIYTIDSLAYFHRLEAGEEIVLTDTCHSVSSEAEIFKNAYNINMMGTNSGYFYFDENKIVSSSMVPYKQYAKNLCDIISIMDDYCGNKMLVVGMFCENYPPYHKDFYEEYESICQERFGKRFFNGRKYLMEEAWKELGITLTADDYDNISKGLAPWSLFGDGVGVRHTNPHLTTSASKALSNKLLNKMWELGWLKNAPKQNQLTK